jgi:uroporphyrinogen decarboxylase
MAVMTVEPRDRTAPLLVRAARGEAVGRPPVWFMRQAGRSLPEYRRARGSTGMLDACRNPDLVAELTMQPVRRHHVDAAVLFSDIVVPLAAVGVDVDIKPGVGPVMGTPVRTAADVAAIRPLDAADVDYISEAVRILVAELSVPLIGFAGAPFTLASYLIEGGPSRDHARTKALMHAEPELWHDLAGRLAGIAGEFLRVQAEAGASVVQLFDSWAGALSPADYAEFVLPHSAAALGAIAGLSVPRIHFGVGCGELLRLMRDAGAEVVGVDWRVALPEAARRIGRRAAVQGNLDPALLGAPWPVVEAAVDRIIAEGRLTDGHIFNLGHGVPPDSDPDVLTRIVAHLHAL